MNRKLKYIVGLGAVAAIALTAYQAGAQNVAAVETYADIERTLGMVPSFFRAFPEVGIAGAWAEFKSIQLNPDTALSGLEKELIGLAVAAQIPCTYCIYFHTEAARLNGATDEQIAEAVAMASITRHWSTVLNGLQLDYDQFRAETDQVLALARQAAAAPAAAP